MKNDRTPTIFYVCLETDHKACFCKKDKPNLISITMHWPLKVWQKEKHKKIKICNPIGDPFRELDAPIIIMVLIMVL